MTHLRVVALTGGTGFIGTNLLKHLLANHCKVRLLARDPSRVSIQSENIEVIQGGLHDHTSLKKLLDQAQTVIHCAGRVKGTIKQAFEYDNIAGTRQLFELAAQSQQLQSFIHISSLAAREPSLSSYAWSKKNAEDILRTHAYKKWVIIRPPAVYGPNDTELKPLFDKLKQGLHVVPANLHNRFSVLHVDDLSHLIVTLLSHPDLHGKTFEPDDGHTDGYNWVEVKNIARKVFKRNMHTLRVPMRLLKGLAVLNMLFSRISGKAPMLSTEKVCELCFSDWVSSPNRKPPDWRPEISLEQGLKSLYSLDN